ncbi:MAG: hypothetical protein O3C40_22260 [Planctomycetota bacterium]|nr:hypothetical protein [Planctomycetota bacterium]
MNSRIAHQHTIGINRRELLQVGFSGSIGFGLPTLLAQQSRAAESAPAGGSSDSIAAYPASNPYYPSDLGATIFSSLGIDLRSIIKDRVNRPMPASEGDPIAPLFTGAAS